jgi:hypothetical protein
MEKERLSRAEAKAQVINFLTEEENYNALCKYFDERMVDYTAGRDGLEKLLWKIIKQSYL